MLIIFVYVRNLNVKIQILGANTTGIFAFVMVFCGSVQSFSELHAIIDVAEKIANLNVFLF